MKLLLSIFMLALTTSLIGQNATDDFTGKWETNEKEVVTIEKNGNSFEGRVSKHDKVKTILSDITFSGEKWKGTLIKPKDGKKLNCELTLDGNELKIKVVKGFSSRTLTWGKID